MNKKHISAAFLSICMILTIFTSCGSTDSPSSGTSSTGSGAEVSSGETAPEKMTLRFGCVYTPEHPFGPAVEELIADFEAKNQNVTIEREFMPGEEYQNRMKADLASDNLPDIHVIYAVASEGEKAKAGKVVDISPYLDADPQWKDGFIAGAFEGYQYDGVDGIYAAPIGSFCVGFYYNKDLFAKAGAEVPTTWDEMGETIEKLKAIEITPIALGAKDTWRTEHFLSVASIKLNGVDVTKKLDKTSENFASLKEPFEFMASLSQTGAFGKSYAGIDYANEIAAFNNGQAAMRLSGTWTVGEVQTANDDVKNNVGYFPVPYFADKPEFKDDWMGGTSDAYAVSAKLEGQKLETAIAFVKHMTSSEASKIIMESAKDITAVKAEVDATKTGELFSELSKAMSTGKKFCSDVVSFESDPAVAQKIYDLSVSITIKQLTPEEAIQQLIDTAAQE